MISGEILGGELLKAVLALVIVAQKDVVPRHRNPDAPPSDKVHQSDHGGHLHGPGHGPKHAIIALDDLHFPHAEHGDRPLPRDDPQWLIGGVEEQSAVHPAMIARDDNSGQES